MDLWELNFTGDLNASVQIGDNVYSAGSTSSVDGENFQTTDIASGATNYSSYQSNILLVGVIQSIERSKDTEDSHWYKIIIKPNEEAIPPGSGSYVFFGKNHEVNASSMKGYYNSIKFENNSKRKAELFAATCSIESSSK
tara:strand:+ start:2057 stop:2476 length:420 start_codon:yes stop_codon:yes gene_type:complete